MPSSPRRAATLKPMNAPATPTSALVTTLRVEPAIWRVSQPGESVKDQPGCDADSENDEERDGRRHGDEVMV